MKHWTILVASTMAWLGAAPIAHADEAVIVTGGSANEHDRSVVAAAVETTTRSDGWSVRSKPLTKKDASSLLDCQDFSSPWTCVPASLHAGGTHHVLVFAVDRRQTDNGAPMAVITGKVIATDTQASAVKQRFCVQCADDKLTSTAGDLALELLRDLAVREGHTIIEVRSTPSGAQIVLDGRPVQATDASLNTYPGKHVVIVEKPGFQREIREVIVARGKTAELVLALRPSASTSDRRGTSHRWRTVPAVVLGAGAAALVAGVALYAVDDDPSPTGGRKYRDTAPTGVAIGVAGLATAGVGAFLWYRASRARSAPSVVVSRGGALFAWSGSF